MNVIVIVSDTFRYDYLGANGNDWIRTPELDAFSRIAVNFDRCTISSFPTIPTRTDWFTGRCSFPFHGWQPLDAQATVLAGELGKAFATLDQLSGGRLAETPVVHRVEVGDILRLDAEDRMGRGHSRRAIMRGE